MVTVVTKVLLNFIGLHVKFMPFFPDFNKTYPFPTGFSNISEHKLHENPSSGKRVAPSGQTDGQA
jgi:hypothetical protein